MNMNVVVGIEWITSLLAIFFGGWGLLYTEIMAGTTRPGTKKTSNRTILLFVLCAVCAAIAFLGAMFYDFTAMHDRTM